MADIDPAVRSRTDIKELDEMLNGGLIKNTITLISGPPGSGKTLIGLSFVYAGAKRGEGCLYVSLEEDLSGIKCAAKSIGLKDFEDFLEKNKIVLLDIGKMRMDGDFEDVLNVKNILKHVQTFTNGGSFKFERVVIDSISALDPSYPSEGELRKALFHLFTNLRERNVTTLATTEVEASDALTRHSEAYLADTVIRLNWNPRLSDKAAYLISVPKMRYSHKSNKEFQYRISDRGIKISTQAQVW